MTKKLEKLAHLFYELGSLRKIARSHRQALLTNDLSDNISSHSYRVTTIGWFLAKLEKADPYKVVTMCLFHDAAEARTGDQNWVNKKYVKTFEDEVTIDQFSGIPAEKELLDIAGEYEKRESLESKLAKDADILDQILLLKEYAWQGNQEAMDWLNGREHSKRIFSPSAKKLAQEILSQKPSDWWSHSGWTADRRR